MKVWQSRSAAAAVCALLGELAWAQSAPGTTTLPAVTVRGATTGESYNVPDATTATKTDTPIHQTPASIQVIPRAVLEDKQSMTLPDAVNGHVSGVLGRTGGGFLYDNFIIRGFSGSGFGDAYRNGLYNRQDIYDLSNIEQIEVLKGPAAVLYGRIEPGGLINYITKKAQTTRYFSLQQQIGTDHQFRTAVDATGPLDENRTLLYRLNVSYTDNESFRDFVGNERFFIAPTLTWRPNSSFEATLELEHKKDRFQADYGIPAVGTRPAPIPLTRNLSDGPKRQSIENTLIAFDWTYRFNDDWQIKQRYHQQDWTFDAAQVLAGAVQGNNRTQNRNILFSVQDVKTQATNLDLTGKFNLLGAKHSVLIGVDAFHATTEARQLFTAAPTIDIFNPVYGLINWDALARNNNFYRKERWSGVYAQDQITLFDKLHVLIGARYDSVQTGAIASPVSMEAARAARIERSDDQISPRFGLLYQLQPWLSTYASYTKSFGGNNGVSANGAPFEPQQGKQYEIGVKTESADKRLSSTLSVFDLTRSNLLTADLNNPGFQILAGEAKSKGIELDVAGQVTDRLKVLATYAYTDAKYVRDNGTLLGKRLENSPLHQGSVWGTFRVNDAFKVGLGGVAVGMRHGDPQNTYQLPGYGRIDAMASYTQRMGAHRLTLQINVNNLLDKDYYANSSGGRATIIPGAPRSVLGSLKYEY